MRKRINLVRIRWGIKTVDVKKVMRRRDRMEGRKIPEIRKKVATENR